MSRKTMQRFGLLTLGVVFCLAVSSCRTSGGADGLVRETPDDEDIAKYEPRVFETLKKTQRIIIPEMTFSSPVSSPVTTLVDPWANPWPTSERRGEEVPFRSHATIIDAVDFLNRASREYDTSGASPDQRGVTIELRLPDRRDSEGNAVTNAPVILMLAVRQVSLRDALNIVCEATDMSWVIRDDGRIVIARDYGSCTGFVTKSYNVPVALDERIYQVSDETDGGKALQSYSEKLGVTWPEGTSATYLAAIGKLRVTNTPENLEIVGQILDMFIPASMIEVEMDVHAFRPADIERLRLSGGGVSVETLMALRRQGKSRPVASASALTRSGQEVIVKAQQEVSYPTDTTADVGTAIALMPADFEMREVGMILETVPEVMQGNVGINLLLNPQWVTLDGWETYPMDIVSGRTHRTFPFRQPVFDVTSFQTQAAVGDGKTILLGSVSTPDGEWEHAAFLTARLRRVETEALWRKSRHEKSEDTRVKAVTQKLKEIIVPEVAFRPPATIIDAMDFFVLASRDYDKPEIPAAKRGVNFALKLPQGQTDIPAPDNMTNAVPIISSLSARFIRLYDAVKLVCDVTGMKMQIKDGVVWIVPVDDPCGEMVTRTYFLRPPLCGCSFHDADTSHESDVDTSHKQDWKTFFGQLGVKWPEGSSIYLSTFPRMLRVTNTPEQLEVLEQILADIDGSPFSLVCVDMQVAAFRTEDIERLRLAGDMTVEALTGLRKAGKSKPVASASVVTKSGQEAVVKAVREMIYPTEMGATVGGDNGGSNQVARTSGGGALMPSALEMREVGMVLQVVPETTDSGKTVNVLLNPRWVTLDRWETYPAALASGGAHKTLPFRQPVFGGGSYQTAVTVEDGGTVLLGSTSTPDGDWVHVGFLTVKRLGQKDF